MGCHYINDALDLGLNHRAMANVIFKTGTLFKYPESDNKWTLGEDYDGTKSVKLYFTGNDYYIPPQDGIFNHPVSMPKPDNFTTLYKKLC